jgi:hypothetical protein
MSKFGASRFATGTILCVALICGSCDQEDPGDAHSDAGNASTGPGPACIDGEVGCVCVDGSVCASGLVCEADLCVEPPVDPTAVSDGADSSGGADTGGVDGCADNDSCDTSEICVETTCIPATDVQWEVIVTTFIPGGCRDGWGDAEIYYRYLQDGAVALTSSYAGCPAEWSEEVLDYDPYATFELEFWELDAIFDDEFGSLCWAEDGDPYACGPIPAEILHDGAYAGTANGDAHYVELVLFPVLG